MKTNIQHFIKIIFLIVSLASCESKFYESKPEPVKKQSVSLDDRLTQKSSVDLRLKQVHNGLLKVKTLFFDTLKKIPRPPVPNDSYSPIDFLIEINKKLSSKIPESITERLVRRASFSILRDFINFETKLIKCDSFEARLESSDGPLDTKTKKESVIITYLVKTCQSMDKYIPLLTVEWKNDEIDFRFNYESLFSIFSMIKADEYLKNSNCKFSNKRDSQKIDLLCENILVRISADEHMIIKSMTLNSTGEVEFELTSDLFVGKVKKTGVNLRIFRNGKIEEF